MSPGSIGAGAGAGFVVPQTGFSFGKGVIV
jgi:hypothetical protein